MRISPVRQCIMGDMTARHSGEKTHKDHIRCVKNLAAFIGRTPETAAAEDLRLTVSILSSARLAQPA